MGIVVSDASPIRALACLSLLDLLPRLFGEVWIPPAVLDELQRASIRLPDSPAFRVQAASDEALIQRLQSKLDRGESEALALAIELGADLVLIDEAKGRAIAKTLGLKPRGVLALLVEAKNLKLIPEVAPLIIRLRGEIHFRMSMDLINDILETAGETPLK